MSNNFKITQDYVKSLSSFTDKFLCEIDDNKFIKFTNMSLKTIFYNQLKKDYLRLELNFDANKINEEIIQKSKEIKDIYKNPRMIRYHLRKDILDNDLKLCLKYKNESNIGFILKMIEKHYFQNEVIYSIEYNLGFCMPNSTNQQEIIYKFNSLKEINNIKGPFEIKTDTFFFANDNLIIHNKTLFYFSQIK